MSKPHTDEYGDTVQCEACQQYPATRDVLVDGKSDHWAMLCPNCTAHDYFDAQTR